MEDYFLVDRGDAMPAWCRLVRGEEGLLWLDTHGLGFPRDAGWPLAHVEGDGPDCVFGASPTVARIERGYAYRHLLDPWSDQGWLAPDGRFYGCRFAQHEKLAHALLRRPVGRMEREGFVRVHADSFLVADWAPRDMRLTARQRDVLEGMGFAHLTPGHRRQGRYEPDRGLPPPAHAVRPPAGFALPPERRERPRGRDAAEAESEAALDRATAARSALLERLRASEDLSGALAGEPAHDADFGGRWAWMLRFDGFDLGAEEDPVDLLAAPGLELVATAFDQVEVLAGSRPGIRVSEEALAALCPRAAVPGR